jgi:hypothetical protein
MLLKDIQKEDFVKFSRVMLKEVNDSNLPQTNIMLKFAQQVDITASALKNFVEIEKLINNDDNDALFFLSLLILNGLYNLYNDDYNKLLENYIHSIGSSVCITILGNLLKYGSSLYDPENDGEISYEMVQDRDKLKKYIEEDI